MLPGTGGADALPKHAARAIMRLCRLSAREWRCPGGKMSLNRFRSVRGLVVGLKRTWLRRVWKLDIHPTVEMSLSSRFDLTHPKGIHIGAYTYVAFDARILSHDMTRNMKVDTRIGQNCFIGGRSLILPGVTIGDSCIVGAGSVVTRSVPANSIVAGNPARVLYSGVRLLSYGRIDPANPPVRDIRSMQPQEEPLGA